MKFKEFKHTPVQPDTYEASMALNQLMRIGKHAIKLHNMIDDRAEMESWVAKKIDLAGDYVKKVYNYTEGEKAGLYDDGGMTEDAGDQDDWTKLLNAVAQRYGKEKARVIHDYAQHGTDSGRELMRDYGLTPGDGWWEDQPKWFKKFPWLEKLDKTSWMSRLVDIAGQGPEYGGAGYEYPKGLESVAEDEDKKTVIHSITPGSEKEKGMMQAAIFQGGKRTNVLAATPKDLANQYIKNGVNYNDFNFLHTSDVDFPEEDDGWNNEKYGNDAHGFIQDALKILKNYKGESLEARLEAKLREDAGEQALANDLALFFAKRAKELLQSMERPDKNDQEYEEFVDIAQAFKKGIQAGLDEVNMSDFEFSNNPFGDFGRGIDEGPDEELVDILNQYGYQPGPDGANDKATIVKQKEESVSEDAGEGHMSKSTLYHTAKYAIELMQMIKPGDDLEGWVQSKLNKAADYLQGVYNYEEYQKLNPYREELDSNVLQKHAQVVQKNIDEILDKETELHDIDTKPGMMRILAKRVNEVEKKMAKENRKNTDEAHGGQHTTSGRSMTKGEMNKREKIVKGMKKDKAGFKKRYGKDADAVMYATATKQAMKDDEANESGILYRAGVKKYGKAGMKAIQSAAGKGASHQEIGKIKDKHLKDDEDLQEGLKDWAKNTAMAGIIVAGLAGVGSIQDAIDRSIPAVQAMETALELAQDQNNDELADMIKKDLSAVKVRLESGKDLGFVKGMQEKYSKFVKTEGLAYESRLAIMLDQRIK